MKAPLAIRIGRRAARVLYLCGILACVAILAVSYSSFAGKAAGTRGFLDLDRWIPWLPYIAVAIPALLVAAILFHLLAQIAASLHQIATHHPAETSARAATPPPPRTSQTPQSTPPTR